jgi:hypothetical protein
MKMVFNESEGDGQYNIPPGLHVENKQNSVEKKSIGSFVETKTVVSFLVGLFIGWILIGWVLWPVTWENASAAELRSDLRTDYAYLSILAYQISPDAVAADRRMGELGEFADEAIIAVADSPLGLHPQSVEYFQNRYVVSGIPSELIPEMPTERNFPNILIISCGITIFFLAVLLEVFYFRRKKRPTVAASPIDKAQEASRAAKEEQVDYESEGNDPPLAQWVTTFMHGDDLFDDSNAINSEAGKFMGECGIGIADNIGVGTPKKVTALELWLFDKNDIQTITKVLMSDHIFNDVNGYERLAAKGEPVLATNGTEIVLETETLQLAARIIDMSYGSGSAPDKSFFEKITLEMAVWEK